MIKKKLTLEEFMALDENEIYDNIENPDGIFVENMEELTVLMFGEKPNDPMPINNTLMGQASVDALRKLGPENTGE